MSVNSFFNMPVKQGRRIPAWAALVLALVMTAGSQAQTPPPPAPTNQPDPQSMKLLRETLADQARNPGKIIRTYTNPPPQQPPPQPQTQLVSPAEVPAAPIPVYTAADSPRSETLSPKAAAAAALERQFLNGKLNERQYKKALADLEHANANPRAAETAAKPKVTEPAPDKGTSRISTNTAVPQPTVRQQKVTEVESRIDEMIRQKEARERAAQTNATTVPTGPLSKRQRLDFLLKQVIDGKLSDPEYKKERDKILAEPD
jgi:hypothetical protein